MTAHLDHLGAAIGAAGVLLLLFFASQSLQAEGMGTTVRYGDARRFDAFTETVEKDFASGSVLDQDAVAGGAFGFEIHTDPQTATRARVEYREVAVSNGLQLERYVDGARAGQSPTLVGWSMQTVDGAGAPVAASAATGLTVRFDALQGEATQPDTAHWARTVHPPGLGRTSY